MDTKLKNSKTKAMVYALLLALETLAVSALAVCGSMSVSLGNMYWVKDLEPEPDLWTYSGSITNQERYEFLRSVSGAAAIVLVVISVALLLALILLVGRSKTDERGRIYINWFDRIWSEAQIILGCLTGVWFASIIAVMHDIWMSGAYLNVWESTTPEEILFYTRGPFPESAEILYCTLGLLISAFITLECLLSLIKKIKARQFWEKSLLGGAFLAIYRSFKSSDKLLFKVMAVLVAGAALSATWIGLIPVLLALLICVPKAVRKFIEIRKGVEEVRSGNLSYKIPVETDEKGVMGELDRLAAGINDISLASSIAVQNELKNQRLKTDLISNVSHDLKTPLTSMITYVDLLKKEGLDSPAAAEYLDIIDRKTQRLKTLTENLFEAAKASSGAMPVNMEAIDLSQLVSQGLAEMEEKLAARGLDVRVKNGCEGVRVLADGQLMWRVIENLLGNVAKYALDGSRVYIDLEHIGGSGAAGAGDDGSAGAGSAAAGATTGAAGAGKVRLDVKNISRDQLNISAEELMERFKRGDESRNTEGSGLGLAIARDLVKLMHGVFEITIDGDLFKATVLLDAAQD